MASLVRGAKSKLVKWGIPRELTLKKEAVLKGAAALPPMILDKNKKGALKNLATNAVKMGLKKGLEIVEEKGTQALKKFGSEAIGAASKMLPAEIGALVDIVKDYPELISLVRSVDWNTLTVSKQALNAIKFKQLPDWLSDTISDLQKDASYDPGNDRVPLSTALSTNPLDTLNLDYTKVASKITGGKNIKAVSLLESINTMVTHAPDILIHGLMGKGFHYPGSNYIGPGTKVETAGPPVNAMDAAARVHDIQYEELMRKGVDAYFTWNSSDRELIKKADLNEPMGWAVFAGMSAKKIFKYDDTPVTPVPPYPEYPAWKQALMQQGQTSQNAPTDPTPLKEAATKTMKRSLATLSSHFHMGSAPKNRVIPESEKESLFLEGLTNGDSTLQNFRVAGDFIQSMTTVQQNPAQESARLRFLLGSIKGIVPPEEEEVAATPAPDGGPI